MYIALYDNVIGTRMFNSWLGVPMMVGEKVLGVIAAYDLEPDDIYDEKDMQLPDSMASQAAIALDNEFDC